MNCSDQNYTSICIVLWMLEFYSTPTNVRELRKLYGFFNYFKKYIRGLSIITICFRQLLTKDSVFHWTAEHDRALENLKKALLSEVVLIYHNFQESFTIITDVSSKASAHMLCQMKDNVLRPVAVTVNIDQQPTVQTALAATSSYWHPATRDNALTECTRNSFHSACLQRSGTADAADCDVSHFPAADSPIPSYTFIAQPDVHTDCTQQSSHCKAESKQRPTLAAYSPAWQVRDSNQVWSQTFTELQTKSLPAQNARISMNHRPQEVKALCSNAAISHSPSMHLSSRHQSPDAVPAVQLPVVTQQHFSLSLTDVSNNKQQLLQTRNFPASDTSHDSVHSKQTVTTKELISKQLERQIKTHQTGISSQGSVSSIDLTETTALDSRMTHTQSAAETDYK
jgi:trans-aconitate methyltransferase